MITNLRLENFKCFEQRQLRLRPLTVLSGLNGTGKSTVFQSLLLLRQSYQRGFLPNQGLSLNGELVALGTAQDTLYDNAHEEVIRLGIRWTNTIEEDIWSFAYDPEADVLSLAAGLTVPAAEVYGATLFSENFHYLGAERLGPRPSFEISEYMVRHQRQIGSRGEFAAHFLATFGRERIPIPSLAHEGTSSLDLVDQVEAWLGTVSPGVRLSVIPHRGMDVVNLQYSFAGGRDVSNLYRPTNVGFGLTYTLPVLVAILSSRASSVLLVENPEAHLHPRGQIQLARLLARAAENGVQVLVETHSDHILNGIRLAVYQDLIHHVKVQLHFFERREAADRVVHTVLSPEMDRNARLDLWPGGFFDEWDRSLEALLAPRSDAG
jgi:predicted ATPase